MERFAKDRSYAFLAWAILVAFLGTYLPTPAVAQQAASASYDPSLRSLQYYRYKRVAESGPERGRELYYFKCWQCHNEFQKTAPQLKGLYEGGRQVAGETITSPTRSAAADQPCQRSATSSTMPTSPTS